MFGYGQYTFPRISSENGFYSTEAHYSVCVRVRVCVWSQYYCLMFFLFFSDRKNLQPRKPCRQECSIGKYLHFVFSPAGAMNFRTLITRTTRAVNLFTCSSPDKLEGLTNHSKQQCGKTMNICFFAV